MVMGGRSAVMIEADKSCANCAYELRASPPPHRCPECGLAYDAGMRAWRIRYLPRSKMLNLLLPAFFGLWLMYKLVTQSPIKSNEAVGAALAVVSGAALSWIIFRPVRKGYIVIVDSTGVRGRDSEGEFATEWNQVVGTGGYREQVVLVLRNSVAGRNLTLAFENHREREAFRAEVLARLEKLQEWR